MHTRTYYETQIMRKLKELPDFAIPEFYQLFNSITHLLERTNPRHTSNQNPTGLCGIWEDDRPVEDIIKEMESDRN